jgi:hypothetical protein
VLWSGGMGPKVTRDCFWNINLRPTLLPQVGLVVKVIASIGAFMLCFCIAAWFRLMLKQKANQTLAPSDNASVIGHGPILIIKTLAFIFLACYGLFLLVNTFFFDRYYMVLLPLLIILLSPIRFSPTKVANKLGMFSLVVIVFFSVCATHDYLAWNTARWELLEEVIAEGISPNDIDGGFEFNAWYDQSNAVDLVPNDDKKKSWWCKKGDTYLIAFGAVEGYVKFKRKIYVTYLTPGKDQVFLLKKISDSTIH